MEDYVAQDLVFLFTQVVSAQIKCAAMQAENALRASKGEAQAYGEKSFTDLIEEHGISHNQAIGAIWRR